MIVPLGSVHLDSTQVVLSKKLALTSQVRVLKVVTCGVDGRVELIGVTVNTKNIDKRNYD